MKNVLVWIHRISVAGENLNATFFFFTIINLLTVAVYTLTHTHYNSIVIVKFDAEPDSEQHANHM